MKFIIYKQFKLHIGANIEAENFEDAVSKANKIDKNEFLEITGECIENEEELVGINKEVE